MNPQCVSPLDPVTLSSVHGSVVPLAASHHDALCVASDEGEVWKLWYTSVPSPQGMAAEIERRLAVEFRTAFFNRQSRAAIERLGAKLDGVLRSHRRFDDGAIRDTCVYSIIAAEWPAVRRNLEYMLASRRPHE